MMQFTEEQKKALIQFNSAIIAQHEAYAVPESGWPEHVRLLVSSARIALADLTAEPVGWTDEQELRDVQRGGCGYIFSANPVTPHADERRVMMLYTAPPVVAPAVPDGWKLVPVDPTKEMLDAVDIGPKTYKALLAAAPEVE